MKRSIIVIAGVSVAAALAGQSLATAAVDKADSSRAALFSAAAKEFGVPEKVLLAISYNESRWTPHEGPSNNNGYGLMNLRASTTDKAETSHADSQGHGKPGRTAKPDVKIKGSRFAFDDAAKTLKVPANNLKNDDRQNIRGAAAALAQYGKNQNRGKLPKDASAWYGAIAAYSGEATKDRAQTYADDVYAVMRSGASLTTSDGEVMALTAEPSLQPDTAGISSLGLAETTTDPTACTVTTVSCTFAPAAYAQNSADPTDYGNYDTANRPADMPIKYIVIHNAEGTYNGTISWFQNPASYVSGHYVIRSNDGAVTEMVRPKDVAWGAGNWYTNMHAINIEHEGYAADGASWYTDAMYRSSATLVRELAAKYNIPLDRQHIIGHTHVPGLTASAQAGQHWDPGPYWNWDRYMELVQGTPSSGLPVGTTNSVATIKPNFATNKPVITKCTSKGKQCTQPAQGANIVYLRTQATASAPLVNDKYLHTGRTATGTTLISDWSATATAGSRYVVAGASSNGWTPIWYGGQKAWFANPVGGGRTAVVSNSTVITPRAGLASAPVYGGAYPEATAYPTTITPQSLATLYTIPAGQAYTVNDEPVTDYFYAPTIDGSRPDDHTVVIGNERFYQISFNHRTAYVKAADVTLSQR